MPIPSRTLVAHSGSRVFSGTERWTARLLADLGRRGHRVLFLLRDDWMAEEARAFGIETRVVPLGGRLALHQFAPLTGLLRALRPDGLLLTHFAAIGPLAAAGYLAAVPRIVSRIGSSSDCPSRAWDCRVATRRWIHRTVTNAHEIRERWEEKLPGLEVGRILTLYNGVRVPARTLPRGTLRSDLGIPPEAPVAGTLARLHPVKRLDRLLALAGALPDLHLLIAGDGPERPVLMREIHASGLSDRVHLVGHRDAVGDVLGSLDLYLVCSECEGMSNGMLEALAFGIPVVSTPVSGAVEALSPLASGELPGRIVAQENESLARAVHGLLSAPLLRERMARAALLRVRERFDPEAKVDAWERLLGGRMWEVKGEEPLAQGGAWR